jgi:hypothetical protein
VAVLFCLGCNSGAGAKNADEAKQQRDTRVLHENCDIESGAAERLDANGVGRADLTILRNAGRELCRAADFNFDGIVDTWSYSDRAGRLRRREHDFDRDGRIDEIGLYKNGVVQQKLRATTLVGQLDTWEFYQDGRLVRTERDSDGDAIIDQWWEYTQAGCPMMHSDVNRDGKPDVGATIDYCRETGYVPPERQTYRQAESPDFQRTESLPTETEVKEAPAEPTPADKPAGKERPKP